MNIPIAIFNTHAFGRAVFDVQNSQYGFSFHYFEACLNADTAPMANGFEVVCCFVNDRLDEACAERLADAGVKLVALRCAGFNQVDLRAMERCGIRVVRVPAYSPYAIAEHAMGLILSLNRKIHHAYWRVKQLNFALDGLVGFDLHGKTLGVVGTGKIGAAFARIAKGFGCRVLASDPHKNAELVEGQVVEYVVLDELFAQSDIVSLHVPLTPDSYHLVNARSLELMKADALLINTSRGALVDSQALIQALKSSAIAGAGLDVYEEEAGIFFEDLSDRVLQDDTLARLMTFPNVLITAHQGFLTQEALANIASTTLANIDGFLKGAPLENEVLAKNVLCRAGDATCKP